MDDGVPIVHFYSGTVFDLTKQSGIIQARIKLFQKGHTGRFMS